MSSYENLGRDTRHSYQDDRSATREGHHKRRSLPKRWGSRLWDSLTGRSSRAKSGHDHRSAQEPSRHYFPTPPQSSAFHIGNVPDCINGETGPAAPFHSVPSNRLDSDLSLSFPNGAPTQQPRTEVITVSEEELEAFLRSSKAIGKTVLIVYVDVPPDPAEMERLQSEAYQAGERAGRHSAAEQRRASWSGTADTRDHRVTPRFVAVNPWQLPHGATPQSGDTMTGPTRQSAPSWPPLSHDAGAPHWSQASPHRAPAGSQYFDRGLNRYTSSSEIPAGSPMLPDPLRVHPISDPPPPSSSCQPSYDSQAAPHRQPITTSTRSPQTPTPPVPGTSPTTTNQPVNDAAAQLAKLIADNPGLEGQMQKLLSTPDATSSSAIPSSTAPPTTSATTNTQRYFPPGFRVSS